MTLTPKRVQILLTYVETDILDTHKQATAFSLIKAIIGKKIQDEKVFFFLLKFLGKLKMTLHKLRIVKVFC